MDLREKKTKRSIANTFHADQSLIETLFSETQNAVLPMRIEAKLRAFIRNQYPDMDKEADMRLTYNIYGSYYVYQRYYKSTDMNEIIHVVSEAKI